MKFNSVYRFGLSLAAACCIFTSVSAQKNVAYQDQNVRISVITDGVVRMEYAPDGPVSYTHLTLPTTSRV